MLCICERVQFDVRVRYWIRLNERWTVFFVEVCTLLSAFLVNHQLLQHFVHRYGNDVGASWCEVALVLLKNVRHPLLGGPPTSPHQRRAHQSSTNEENTLILISRSAVCHNPVQCDGWMILQPFCRWPISKCSSDPNLKWREHVHCSKCKHLLFAVKIAQCDAVFYVD